MSCDAERLSYRQLDAEAGRLAGYLRARGVDAEVPVGVCLERSAQQVVALLAILGRAGVCAAGPRGAVERNQYLMDDTAMPLVVTQERLREAVTARARRRWPGW